MKAKSVRLSHSEWDIIATIAERENVSIGEWCRGALKEVIGASMMEAAAATPTKDAPLSHGEQRQVARATMVMYEMLRSYWIQQGREGELQKAIGAARAAFPSGTDASPPAS